MNVKALRLAVVAVKHVFVIIFFGLALLLFCDFLFAWIKPKSPFAQSSFTHIYAFAPERDLLDLHRYPESLTDTPLLPTRASGYDLGHAEVDYSQANGKFLYSEFPFLQPNIHDHSLVKYKNGEVIYDVPINTDLYGRRLTEQTQLEKRHLHLLTMGCSFTFGNGLREDQTLASQIALHAPEYHAYNYGYSGAGPFQTLRRLQDMKPGEVPEENGVGVYVFIPDHLRRMHLSTSFMKSWGDKPTYRRDPAGRWVRYATADVAYPLESRFYSLMGFSAILKFFNIDLYLHSNETDYQEAASFLREMADTYHRLFGLSSRFLVFLFPSTEIPNSIGHYLSAEGVDYIDYTDVDVSARVSGSLTISPADGHPSAAQIAVLAKALAQDLRIAPRTTNNSHITAQ